uniref:Uncharacterized protein n=1 Tax=Myotis myotis TaxID=51298 RepID=A0A7J7RUU7_MYOMY|nr:hypothetical protein mMyoMyo1_010173 [Myotis myotis]
MGKEFICAHSSMCRYLRVHDALLLFPLTHPGCSVAVQADMALPVSRARVCSGQGGRAGMSQDTQLGVQRRLAPAHPPWLRRPRPLLPTRLSSCPLPVSHSAQTGRGWRDWATDNANALLFTMNHPEGQTEKAELSADGAGPGWKTRRQRGSGCWGEAVATKSLAQEHTPTKEPSFITRGGSE